MTLIYRVGQLLFKAVGCFYFRWEVRDRERVPAFGPVILVANHASYLDPPLIGAALKRDIHYLARASLFRHRLFGAVLRAVNCVPVDRERGSPAGLKGILQRLRAGGGVLLFPEGTRTFDGRLQPAEAGVGMLVIKSTCPVVPVRLLGTYEAYGRHIKFPRPRRVSIRFGLPLDFALVRKEAESRARAELKELYKRVANEAMEAVARLGTDTDTGAVR